MVRAVVGVSRTGGGPLLEAGEGACPAYIGGISVSDALGSGNCRNSANRFLLPWINNLIGMNLRLRTGSES